MTIPISNPLHLYRSTLREATYLFDRNARQWVEGYVKSCFRQYAGKIQIGKQWKIPPYDSDRTPTVTERHHLKRGRKFLVLLQRANQGYQRSLRTLLQLVYGRKGRRKRALTAPCMQNLAPNAQAETKGIETSFIVNAPTKFSKEWQPAESFLSMLHTQNQLSKHLSLKRKIRLNAFIADKNKWGRPMHPSRITNMHKKWYASMASILMPPVSEPEWQELKDIALRKQEYQPVSRRPMATMTPGIKQKEDQTRAASTIVSGVEDSGGRFLHLSIRTPHNLTPRFLSRFYARHILNHSPVAEPNPTGKGWVSKWDDGKRFILSAEKPKNAAQVDALFG